MLDGFRKHSNSIIVKALLFLLIASFAAWGVGDMLRPATQGNSIGTVGGIDVSAQEVFNDFQREMNRMRQLTGDQGVNEQLSLMIGNSVVERAINRTLLEVNADDMGVAISDDLVAKSIRETEAFQEDGQFSRIRFEQILFSNQLTEDQYIELVRGDLAREQIISALVSGATMPKAVAQDLYKHRQEQRSAQVVRISQDNVGEIAAPSDEEVRKYYDDNIDKFMAPEYRSISLLHIKPQDVAKNIDVPLEKIENLYTERQEDLKKPERRSVEQMVFTSEEEANTAIAQMKEGKAFEAVAKDVFGLEQDSLLLGDVTKEELPEELRDAVFALEKDGISEPIQSMLGWHVARVTTITESVNPEFDEVKDQLRDELAIEMAADELYAISNDVEDALGGGATIEEAAKTAGYDLKSIAFVDAQGLDKDGKATEIVSNPTILQEIFELSMNAEPSMKDDDLGGYFMVRVDAIEETKARSFEAVKDQAANMVLTDKKLNAAKEKADALLAAVKGGTKLEEAAQAAGFEVSIEEGFTRFDSGLPKSVITDLFAAKVNEAVNGESPDGYVVAVLSEIKPLSGSANDAAINALQAELTNGMTSDLQGQFVNALRGRYSVSVDRSVVNRLFVQEQP
ncbi:MAG: SurA N-terminal domain-containing protein [Methylocystaceae bacterium]|nr:SurA N-terminal domain-containing protein [Methylocystaceae bacterium]